MNICLFVAHLPSCPAALFHSFTLAQLHVNKRDLAISRPLARSRTLQGIVSLDLTRGTMAGGARAAQNSNAEQAAAGKQQQLAQLEVFQRSSSRTIHPYYALIILCYSLILSLQSHYRPGLGPAHLFLSILSILSALHCGYTTRQCPPAINR